MNNWHLIMIISYIKFMKFSFLFQCIEKVVYRRFYKSNFCIYLIDFCFSTFWQSSYKICLKEIHLVSHSPHKLWESKISRKKNSLLNNKYTWTCALHWKLVFILIDQESMKRIHHTKRINIVCPSSDSQL